MELHDLAALTAALPTLDVAGCPSREEAMAAAPLLCALDGHDVRVARFRGQPPWERHPADELVYVLDGDVEVTLLDGAEPRAVALRAGSLLLVPRGVWHRSHAPERVTVLAVTPAEGNENSMADDPRAGSGS